MERPPKTQADHLLLDAKKAILQDQHRRFQDLQRQGRWEEAWKQLHITLSCAADLLHDSVAILEGMVGHKRLSSLDSPKGPPDQPGFQ